MNNIDTIESQKTEEIKQALANYNSVHILPSPDFHQDCFPAALAVFYSLKKAGKNVNLITKDHPEKYRHLINGSQHAKSDFVICVKESSAKLGEIIYEKTDQGVNLILKTKEGEIKPEDVSLKPSVRGGLLITLGINDLKISQIREAANLKPDFIINIDNQIENKNFGDINLVDATALTLSEIVFDFLCCLDDTLSDKDSLNALFTGITQELTTFSNPKLNPRTLQTLSCLLEQGAETQKAGERFYDLASEKSLRIFGRILSKIHIDKLRNLAWMLLRTEDFLKTESSPVDLKFALHKLTAGFFPFERVLMLWEQKASPSSVYGVFYSPDKNQLERIAIAFEGRIKGKGVIFKTQENDLKIAKNIIFTILEE